MIDKFSGGTSSFHQFDFIKVTPPCAPVYDLRLSQGLHLAQHCENGCHAKDDDFEAKTWYMKAPQCRKTWNLYVSTPHLYVPWFRYLRQKPSVFFRASNPPKFFHLSFPSHLWNSICIIYIWLLKKSKVTLKNCWQTLGFEVPPWNLKEHVAIPSGKSKKPTTFNVAKPSAPPNHLLRLPWQFRSSRCSRSGAFVSNVSPMFNSPPLGWSLGPLGIFIWFQVEKIEAWNLSWKSWNSENFKRCFWRVSCWKPWLFQRI